MIRITIFSLDIYHSETVLTFEMKTVKNWNISDFWLKILEKRFIIKIITFHLDLFFQPIAHSVLGQNLLQLLIKEVCAQGTCQDRDCH